VTEQPWARKTILKVSDDFSGYTKDTPVEINVYLTETATKPVATATVKVIDMPFKLVFFKTDHLGTPRVITDQDGKVLSTHDYLAYGEELTDPEFQTNRMKFTGHERDPETGLDYMLARYYTAGSGRFLQVDPGYDYKMNDPMSFNLYSYGRENPVRFLDPSGKWNEKNKKKGEEFLKKLKLTNKAAFVKLTHTLKLEAKLINNSGNRNMAMKFVAALDATGLTAAFENSSGRVEIGKSPKYWQSGDALGTAALQYNVPQYVGVHFKAMDALSNLFAPSPLIAAIPVVGQAATILSSWFKLNGSMNRMDENGIKGNNGTRAGLALFGMVTAMTGGPSSWGATQKGMSRLGIDFYAGANGVQDIAASYFAEQVVNRTMDSGTVGVLSAYLASLNQ